MSEQRQTCGKVARRYIDRGVPNNCSTASSAAGVVIGDLEERVAQSADKPTRSYVDRRIPADRTAANRVAVSVIYPEACIGLRGEI